METEIELKFFVSPLFLHRLEEELKEVKILQQRKRYLQNTYFDTQNFLLRQMDMGLRIRRLDSAYIQTLKTSGRVVAGLHQRPEYNAEVKDNTLNLSLIPANAWPKNIELSELSENLYPIFTTNFERQQWLVAMPDGSQIELAFDIGSVSANTDRQDDICEVEIELKSGQVDALFLFARQLAQKGGLRLGNLSKAAKGYRLANDYQGDAIKHLACVPLQIKHNVEQGFVKSLEYALAHWHYHEQIYIERQKIDALVEITHSLTLIRQTLSLYADIIPRRASALLRQELHWLENEFDWIDEALSISRLLEDKAYALRKLNAKKILVSKLQTELEKQPSAKEVLSLFTSSRYCHFLLDLSRWVLARGWQPFLEETGHERLSASILEYANETLSVSWRHILTDFSLEHDFDCFSYKEKKQHLKRNLLTGCCLGALYETEEKNSFRLPWLDLLKGVEDLHLLEPIQALLSDDEISNEDKLQIEKWLKRKEESLLNAMLQSRQIGLGLKPYWEE